MDRAFGRMDPFGASPNADTSVTIDHLLSLLGRASDVNFQMDRILETEILGLFLKNLFLFLL